MVQRNTCGRVQVFGMKCTCGDQTSRQAEQRALFRALVDTEKMSQYKSHDSDCEMRLSHLAFRGECHRVLLSSSTNFSKPCFFAFLAFLAFSQFSINSEILS